jgi:hypothetical protein
MIAPERMIKAHVAKTLPGLDVIAAISSSASLP